MKKIIYLFKIVILIIPPAFMFSCNRGNADSSANAQPTAAQDVLQTPLYHTWNSLKEMEYWEPALSLAEEYPPTDFFPWAGIVSHHILAHEYIDSWFSCLAQMRDIERFFIISPDHFGLSLWSYSLTTGSWDSGFGFVESDREKVLQLGKSLDIELDPNVFMYEHGISSVMPYIKKYFPKAEVIAIVISGESEVNTRIIGLLANLLENEFNKEGKKENFLLISSDFSHGGGIEETAFNDHRSARYLRNADGAFWNMVICDNRSGIYTLDRLGKNNLESFILCHTNSFEISGVDYDITSYFFVYFADRE